MRSLINIAGYDVPDPSSYSGTTSTIVDSARNVEGYVVGAVIRENVAKVEAAWSFISAETWAEIMARFDGSRGGSFYNEVTFFNQDSNRWETRTMYVSDRSATVFVRSKDGSIKGYSGASFSLVEV